MWRALLEPVLLFLSPFLAYAAYLGFRRRYPLAANEWTHGALSTLGLIGLVAAAAGMIFFGLFAERHVGGYVPAHIENGKLVPGRIQ
jgi:hypothetical protein